MDRLGSVRLNQNGAITYYPQGEERTSTPDGQDKFATYFRDGFGEDYAGARYYSSNLGRFWSSDVKGFRAAHPSNPTSWNRYAYANDDPVNRYDPIGRIAADPNDPGDSGNYSSDCVGFQTMEFGDWGEDSCSGVGGGGGEVNHWAETRS